jgi:hypothetical protein
MGTAVAQALGLRQDFFSIVVKIRHGIIPFFRHILCKGRAKRIKHTEMENFVQKRQLSVKTVSKMHPKMFIFSRFPFQKRTRKQPSL